MINFFVSKKFKVFLVWLIFLFLIFSSFLKVLAQEESQPSPQPSSNIPALEELEKVKKEVEKQGGSIVEEEDIVLKIVRIIRYFLDFIGIIFILMIIYGGFMWMTGFNPHEFTFGDEEQVKKAKKLLRDAIIGLVIIILARVIYYFVTKMLKGEEHEAIIR